MIAGAYLGELAGLVAAAWHADDPSGLADEVTAFRRRFTELRDCT